MHGKSSSVSKIEQGGAIVHPEKLQNDKEVSKVETECSYTQRFKGKRPVQMGPTK